MRQSEGQTIKLAGMIVCTFLAAAHAQSVPVSLTIEAEEFSAAQGATYNRDQPTANYLWVDSLGNNDWLRYDSINFMNGGFDSVVVWYWNSDGWAMDGKQVIVRIDSPQGTVIGSIALHSVGDWMAVPAAAALSVRPTGIHPVYLTFSGDAHYVCDVDKFGFTGKMAAGPSDAKTYYVSTTGNDADSGTSVGRPFRTIGKAASVMKPGSRCLIRRGIYRETVKPLYTGLSGAPLTFEAYNGENVVIDGADPVGGWTGAGIAGKSNIYKTQQMNWSLGRYKDQLLVDGKMAWVARCPNVDESFKVDPDNDWCGWGRSRGDWKKYQSMTEAIAVPTRICFGASGSEYGEFSANVWNNPNPYNAPAALFGRPADFFKGGLIILHNFYWQKAGIITGSQTKSATETEFNAFLAGVHAPSIPGPAWISYVLGLLDSPNEWYRDSASSTVYLWAPDGQDPSRHLVEAKRRTLGFDLRGKQYVNLKGLRFIATSATLANASNCVVDGCYFKYVSHNDVPQEYEIGAGYNTRQDASPGHLGVYVTGDHNTVRNSSVVGSAASGIIVGGQYNTITNCRISACDYSVTYHAGILVRKCFHNDDPNDALGIRITHNTLSYNSRCNIQISSAARPTSADERLLIEYNDLGPAVYAMEESGSIDAQNASLVHVTRNWFHGVGNDNCGSISPESDIGGDEWVVDHNVFWKGTGPNTDFLRRGWDCSPSELHMIFNNTIVDSTDPSHWDWEYMRSFNPNGTLSNGPQWPEDRGNQMWPRDTAYWKFADPLNGDYSLRAGSPAINAGIMVTGMPAGWPDANADVTDGKPDLGAYEYGRPRWVAGADWQEQPWVYPPSVNVRNRAPVNLSPLATFRPSLRVGHSGVIVAGLGDRDCRITVFDAKGAVASLTNARRAETAVISTSRFGARVYFVRVSAGGNNALWKVWIGAR